MNSLPMVFISSSPGEFYILLIILGLLNFILKEWCTISRGAEPHAQKVNDEKGNDDRTLLKRVVISGC